MEHSKTDRVVLMGLVMGMAFCLTAQAEVKLHSLFSDNMVLQRDKPVPVWGTAKPGEGLTVSIGKQHKTARADAEGNWSVMLDPMPVGTNQTLAVKGDNEITLKNVAIGDVFLCSGQSNMAFGISQFNDPYQEKMAANHPDIRLFTVPLKITITPQREFAVPTQWQVCSPDTILHFSATAYYFGRELQQELGVPIGLLVSAWGGTGAGAWMSRDVLMNRDDMRDGVLATEDNIRELMKGTLSEQMKTWWRTNDPGTMNHWGAPAFDDSAWKTVKAPGPWQKTEIGNILGVVWFRRQIEIPAAWEGKEVALHLGAIGDRDTTCFNGESVGDMSMFVWHQQRVYPIPGNLVKAGKTTIAVGIFNAGTGDKAGLIGNDDLRLELVSDPAQKVDLSGDWKYRIVDTNGMQPLPRQVLGNLQNPNQLTVLFNGMISPLVPFAVRGVIWYQGESDDNHPALYQTLFPDLIRDWRRVWNVKQDGSEFGFYFVQLPNFAPSSGDWPGLRDAQTMALKVPRTAMATTIDIGDASNIHPGNKQDVGKRLALAVLATEYGKKIEFSGPMFSALRIKGGEVHLNFSHAQGLKTVDAAMPTGFAIQGEDDKWLAASARIKGETVIVWNDSISKPKSVRYAWENNPRVNLVNAANLPAVPFWTDTAR